MHPSVSLSLPQSMLAYALMMSVMGALQMGHLRALDLSSRPQAMQVHMWPQWYITESMVPSEQITQCPDSITLMP